MLDIIRRFEIKPLDIPGIEQNTYSSIHHYSKESETNAMDQPSDISLSYVGLMFGTRVQKLGI